MKHIKLYEDFINKINEKSKSHNIKVGQKIKAEGKKPGFFVDAVVLGVRGDMIEYKTSEGDYGHHRYDNERKISY